MKYRVCRTFEGLWGVYYENNTRPHSVCPTKSNAETVARLLNETFEDKKHSSDQDNNRFYQIDLQEIILCCDIIQESKEGIESIETFLIGVGIDDKLKRKILKKYQ